MDLHPDFRDLLAAFASAGVRYLIIGGHAVGLHSRPRWTKDMDLLVAGDADNVARVVAALTAFGAPQAVIAAARAASPDEIVFLGAPPVRVDLLRKVEGVDFEAAYARRAILEWGGVTVSVIGRDDLIANKRACGRPQDRRDVKELERAKKADAASARRR